MNANDQPQDAYFSAADEDQGQDAGQMLQRVLNLLRGRWMVLIPLAIVLAAGAAYVGYISKPLEFLASGRVEMNQKLPEVSESDRRTGFSSDRFILTEMELLRSPRVLELAVEDPRWQELVPVDPASSIGTMASSISVRRVYNTSLVDIRFLHEDPQVAVAGLHAVLDAHKRAFAHKYRTVDAARMRSLESRRLRLAEELSAVRQQRDEILGNKTTRVLQLEHDNIFEQVEKFKRAQEEIKLAMIRLSGEDEGNSLASMSDEQLAAVDRGVASMMQRIEELQFSLEVLRNNGIGEGHRRVRVINNEIRTIRDSLEDRTAMLRQGMISPETGGTAAELTDNATMAELERRQEQVENNLASLQTRLNEAGRKLNEIGRLNAEIEALESRLSAVAAQIEQVAGDEIGEHIEIISVADRAQPYHQNARYSRAGAGAIGGVAVAFGLTLLWGLIDRRLRHIDDAEMDLPHVLGSLPALPAKGFDKAQTPAVANAVHHIRTMLQIASHDDRNIFAITSPSREAGKTSLTMALGLSFASTGSRTLLIDGDFIGGGLTRRMKATAHQRLGRILVAKGLIDEAALEQALDAQKASGERIGETLINLGYISREDHDLALAEQRDSSVGLLEVCQGKDLSNCVAQTNLSHLDVLPIGSAQPHQVGTLSPAAFDRVVAAARAAYDTVLIDTGPLLASIEASMAASKSNGALLVIARGEQHRLVKKCIEHLDRIHAELLGIVFNHALMDDVERSSYGQSVTSRPREADRMQMPQVLDPETASRYGPLVSAVAAYGPPEGTRQQTNGRVGEGVA